ncbi:MAG: hypothetical protein LBV36_08550 [Chromatiales bacterium]|nr:hypothetical protein [Chromatiales bacterium]
MLIEHFGERYNCHALELGPGIAANVSFLTGFCSRLSVEDLHRTLCTLGEPYSGQRRLYCPLFQALLPHSAQAPFDLVLLWNLLDYLDHEDIRRLSEHLATLATRGTLLYAMVSTRTRICASPPDYKILDSANLMRIANTPQECDGPRHSQVRLLEQMRGFRVKRSFLLRNGMQEYLFEKV